MGKFSLALYLLLLTSSAQALDVHGHRGARARRPENTLPAFEYAIDVGVQYLELDLAVTKDNVLVVSHDPHISKVICLDPKSQPIQTEPLIHTLTLAQVKKYDCGTLKNPRFLNQQPVPGTRIPTLREVFQLVKKSKKPAAAKLRFNIETKIFADHPEYTVTPEKFAELLIKELKSQGMTKRTVIESFDYRVFPEIRKLETSVEISALSEDPKEDLVETAKKLKADYISPEQHMLNAENIKALHNLGVKLAPWTVNDPQDWRRLIDWGVDSIITDDPAELLKFIVHK